MKSLTQLSALLFVLGLPLSAAMAQGENPCEVNPCEYVEDENPCEVNPCDAGGDMAPAPAPAPAAEEMGTAGTYPLSAIDRPLTLPKGMIQASGDLLFSAATIEVAGMSTTSTATGLGFGGLYAVDDKIQVGLFTGLGIDPEFNWNKQLNLSGHYLVQDTEKLDIAAGITVPLNFNDGADVLAGFGVDALTRYIAADKVSILAGRDVLNVRIADPFQLDLNLNVGAAYQATEPLSVELFTQLASIGLAGDGNGTSTLADAIPLTLQALFALNDKLDIRGGLNFSSLADAADFYVINVGANFRL